MVWAPDAIWDASKGKTLNICFSDTVNDADYYIKVNTWFIGHPNLYVTCCLLLIPYQPELQYSTSDLEHNGTATNSVIRYAYTSDFKTFTSPETFIAPSFSIIDLALLKLPQYGTNSYARFLKDETDTYVYMERSDDGLFGTWTRPGGDSAIIQSRTEGPYAYLDNEVEGKVNLLLDYYWSDGYRPFTSTDLNANAWVDGDRTNFPTNLRHGSVIGINKGRYDALNVTWG